MLTFTTLTFIIKHYDRFQYNPNFDHRPLIGLLLQTKINATPCVASTS
jgi:hypothetical protein